MHPIKRARQTAQKAAQDNRILPLVSRVLEARHTAPFGPFGAARAPLVGTRTTSVSAASRMIAGNSWWLSAFEQLIRVDLLDRR